MPAALRRNAHAAAPISEVAGLPGRGGGRSLVFNCHLA
jgi:hypothetical protein